MVKMYGSMMTENSGTHNRATTFSIRSCPTLV